jgi:hypothetical protein
MLGEIIADNPRKAGFSWGAQVRWIRLVASSSLQTHTLAILEFEGTIGAAALGCTAWSDDACPKSLVEEIMRLRDQP